MTEKLSLKIDNEEIVFADLTARENLEFVAVCKSGSIFPFDVETDSLKLLAKLPFSSIPTLEKDFDLNESLTELFENAEDLQKALIDIEKIDVTEIPFELNLALNLRLYSFADYICLVENKGLNGVVLNLSKPDFIKPIKREDYHANVCSYPIAFYKKDSQTFLIHGTDWNRLDITCLEIDELLTKRVVDYETRSNYFDYFHSSLSISPDKKYFISNGWHWHPFGQITLYSIDDFLQNFELSYKYIELTDEFYNLDWDRPLCWIDEKTLAIGFNKSIEDYGKTSFPNEILFVDIIENKIIDPIEFNGFAKTSEGDVIGELFYDRENSQFVCLSNKKGLFISDIKGKKIFEAENLSYYKYSAKQKLFYRLNLIKKQWKQ